MRGDDPAPWCRDASDALALDVGCWFDAAAAERPIRFLGSFCRQSQGQWGGRLLALMDWQRDFLRRLYGWRRADGTRRYRSAYLEVPKKQGKSTMAAGLALYHLLADGEVGPKCFINAYDREQASIIFDEAAAMVRASPVLARRLDVVETKKELRWKEGNGRIKANSADVPSKDGANASLALFDELHRQDTWDLWRMFRYAGASRRQPLTLAITTAGVDRQSVCYAQHDYSERVMSGRLPDWQHLGVIYGATAEDDWRDPAVWARCNPSLGVTVSAADFERDVAEVADRPSELNEFLRLRLCVWTQAASRFLERSAWDACGGRADASWFAGRPCWAGLDLSSVTDLTALVRAFRDGDYVDVLADVWLPGESIERRVRRDRVPYDVWAREGLVRKTPGRTVDYREVRAAVVARHRETPFVSLFADPHNATQLLAQLADEDGVPVTAFRQSMAYVTGPTKELERLVTAGLLRHGGDPVLTWAADNAEAERDGLGNVRLCKRRSRERIDPLAATVNALAAMLAGPEASVYATRGLLTF
jgi:phage terminase large subunit-like protein